MTGRSRAAAPFGFALIRRCSSRPQTKIFACFGEDWVTPPLGDGLLPGIWRARFLQETGATEKSLTLAELLTADDVVVGNSVRGTVRVAELAADPVTY